MGVCKCVCVCVCILLNFKLKMGTYILLYIKYTLRGDRAIRGGQLFEKGLFKEED